jgi:hypothetical protein
MQHITINNHIFEIRKNVKSQTCNISTSELFFEYDNNNKDSNQLLFFLLFETCFDSAFCHWIYESAIYLSYFLN